MSVRVELGDWTRFKPLANAIRFTVFVDEQKVPAELEIDEFDPVCIHAVAFDDDDQACATGRLLPDSHIGRMAVLAPWRGLGIGARVLDALIEAARSRGDAFVVLNSQTHAMAFYERAGFVAEGDEFMDAGIPHRTMRMALRTAA